MFGVVVVDDEYFVREMIKGAVDWNRYGFTILGEAANSRQAVEAIERHAPDLVLLDINMPGDDGFAVAEAVRRMGLRTRIVIVTGYDTFEFAKKAIQFRVYDYLLKPVVDTELAQILTGVARELDDEAQSRDTIAALTDNINSLLQRVEPSALEPDAGAESPSAQELVERVKRYVEEHLADEDLSVQRISSSLYLNMSYMSSAFKRACGQGLHSYILSARMEQAYQRILHTQDPAEAVAAAVGFKSAVYFSKCLKKYYGRSFQDLRRIQRKYTQGSGPAGSEG